MNNDKKYIKIITYSNFPYGGASANFIRNMALGLFENGQDIEVLLPSGNYYGEGIDSDNLRIGTIKGVPYRHFCFKYHPHQLLGKLIDNVFGPLNLFLFIFKLRMSKKIDVIVKYGVTFSSNLFLLLICKTLGIKFINILPEFYEKPSFTTLNISLIKWYDFFWGINKLCVYADGIIVLSNFLKEYFFKSKHYDKPILIVPNLIDPSLFDEQLEQNNNGNIIIGYAGTPTQKDGIIDLFNSFTCVTKDFPSAQLLIIGDITNGNSVIPELIEHTKALGINDNVTFTGLVEYKEVPRLLNSCDILVLARPMGISAEAGFPTKLGEYFACKKPVVVTKVGDMKNYFKDSDTVVLAEPNNPLDISEGINKLIVDEEKRRKVAMSGYRWMLENLEYKKASTKIIDFIKKITLV